MARRTKEEALETREQLLDAAERVFLERGVGHASLAEVADAAFESAAASDDDPLDSLGKRALSALLQLASSSRVRRVFEVVFLRCEYTDELATVEQRHLREREQCLYRCGSLLDKAVELGQLPRDTDTRMASHLLYALIGGLMRDWVQAPKSFDLKAAAPQLITLFMAGLRAAPPRKTRADIRLVKS